MPARIGWDPLEHVTPMDGRTDGAIEQGALAAVATVKPSLYRFEDFVFSVLVVAYVIASYAAAYSIGRSDEISPLMYSAAVCLVTLAIFVLLFVGYRATWLMMVVRPGKLFPILWRDIRDTYLSRERILRAIPVILLMSIFLSVFTSMKYLIPIFHPYDWEDRVHGIDVQLHGGHMPWELVQPVLGQPIVTFLVNLVYISWLFVLFLVLYWQVFSIRNPLLRAQFLTTFVVSWALNGTLLATLLASAGPCFYGYVVPGENPYQPLMQYLQDVNRHFPVWALNAQDYLWTTYQQGDLRIGSGISAMPSVHVASGVLFALLGWRTARGLGWLMTAFALVILLGSVHLGWHYAVDGYVSLLTTVAIWGATGWFFRRRERCQVSVVRGETGCFNRIAT